MSYALVQSRPQVANGGGYVGSLSDSFASLPAVGSLVIVSFGGAYSGVTYTVSDNQGNTYTKVSLGEGTDNFASGIAYTIVTTSSGTFTVTVAQANQNSNAMQIANFSGNASSSVVDQSNSTSIITGSSISVSTSAATSMAGELIISLYRSTGSAVSVASVPSGYSALMGANAANGAMNNITVASAYYIAGAIATETAAWPNYSAGGNNQGLIVAFKVASAGGPTVSTVSSNSATEGSSIVHTVTLSAAVTGSAASYAITLAGGTATGGGTDYTSTLSNGMFSDSVTVSGGNISVPVGVSTFTVTVSTAGDTIDEANETYTLTIGGTAGTGTITDDDAAPTITGTASSTVTAGDPVVITYSPGLSGQSRTYTLALTDGTAVGGTDYDNTTVTGDFAVTAGTGSVSFSGSTVTVDPGVTEFTLTIGTTA